MNALQPVSFFTAVKEQFRALEEGVDIVAWSSGLAKQLSPFIHSSSGWDTPEAHGLCEERKIGWGLSTVSCQKQMAPLLGPLQ